MGTQNITAKITNLPSINANYNTGNILKTKKNEDGRFKQFLTKDLPSTTLGLIEGASDLLPGGKIISALAAGAKNYIDNGSGSSNDLISTTSELQKQNFIQNLELIKMQTRIQEDARKISTISNILKVRHDTAKNVVNNIR